MENNEKLVTAVDGKLYPRLSCRRISGEFYLKGDINIENSGHCYSINGKWYKHNTGYIIFNKTTSKYEIKNNSIHVEGIVEVEKEKLVLGWFNVEDSTFSLFDKTNKEYLLWDSCKLIDNFYYKQNLKTGDYYYISKILTRDILEISETDRKFKNSLEYDCRNVIDYYIKEYEKHSSNYNISDNIKKYSKYLNDLSFGVEFETNKGMIPPKLLKKLGLIPLRDGSIEGLEYVTVPLSGENGLHALSKSCKALKTFTKNDLSCSLHYHIGNVPRTPSFILALYRLLSVLEDEIFSMFPIYKKYNFGIKRKNYTKPFDKKLLLSLDKNITNKNLNDNFSYLYQFFSGGQSFNSSGIGENLDNVKSHPSDPNGDRKWNINSRYYWVNFVPLVFGNKKTIEFRIHTNTTDRSKVLNFLFIICSIIDYAKKNEKMLLSSEYVHVSLESILFYNINNKTLCQELLNYIRFRKKSIERRTSENIVVDENKLSYRSCINWDSIDKKNIVSKYNNLINAEMVDFVINDELR